MRLDVSSVKGPQNVEEPLQGWWGFFADTLGQMRSVVTEDKPGLCETVWTLQDKPYESAGRSWTLFCPVCSDDDPLKSFKLAFAEGKPVWRSTTDGHETLWHRLDDGDGDGDVWVGSPEQYSLEAPLAPESDMDIESMLRSHLREYPEDAQDLLGVFDLEDVLTYVQSSLVCSDLCALLEKWAEDKPEDVEYLLRCFSEEDLDDMCRDRILDDTEFDELAERKPQGEARDFVLQYLNDNL